MNQSNTALRWAALAALTIATTAAHAASFDLNYAGSFDSTTTLGGTPLASSTPFSITATFDGDPSLNKFTRFPGTGVFEITTLSLTLTGYGTYTAVTGHDLNVYLALSGAGLSDRNGMPSRVSSLFNNKSDSSFNPATPSPVSYSNYSFSVGLYTIPLSGVTGGLAMDSFGISSATASITASAVPEPSEYAAVTGLALGVFALVQRRRKAAGR